MDSIDIVIIDDSAIDRLNFTQELEDRGCNVHAFASSKQALMHIKRDRSPDLVLLDYRMESMDGLACLKEIRKLYTAVDLPVIMVTGEMAPKILIEAFEIGANDFITKPIILPIVWARIKGLYQVKKTGERVTRLQKMAVEANQAKSLFLSHINHEIRPSVDTIITTSESLNQSSLTEVDKNKIETINTAGHNLLTLMNDLFDLSKLDDEQFQIDPQPFKVSDLTDQTMAMFHKQALASGITLTTQVDASTPTAMIGDSQKIKQVLVKLITNALKFTSKGEVRLSLTPSELRNAFLRFSVSDTGIGIAPAHLEHIFDPFTQVLKSVNKNENSTGLGLPLARSLVEKMGGRLFVESNLDVGSTFYFEIPYETVPEKMITANE